MAVVIDFHTHARRGAPVEPFIGEMDRLGIGWSVVSAVVPAPDQTALTTNEEVHRLVSRYPDRLIGFASVMPTEDDAPRRLEGYVREFGFRGLKLHPPLQGFSILDPRIGPTVAKAIELDIPILIHTGPVYIPSRPLRLSNALDVDDLAIEFPRATIVIAHGDPLGDSTIIAAKHPNVYTDTAYVFPRRVRMIPGAGEAMLEMMRRDDKLLFGSDGGPGKLERAGDALSSVMALEVAEETRAKIVGGVAAKLLKL